MKKTSSVVWKFFDRILENGRCVCVVCKLCECQYKFFGNTTNLRVHLINKHPVQWEVSGSGADPNFNLEDALAAGTITQGPPAKRRKYKTRDSDIKNVDITQNSDSDADDDNTTLDLVRQMHGEQQSDEEWLDEDPYQITHIETYEPKMKRKKKYRTIKREVPSPTGLPGYYTVPKAEKVIFEDVNSKDEYSVFGEYVANKIRKIKTPRTRGNLQQLITTILWQAEYGVYDNADTVRRVLLMNVDVQEPQNVVDFDSTTHTVLTEEVVQEQTDDHSGDSKTILN